MKLHEYQSKALLAQHGVPIPASAGVVMDAAGARAAAAKLGGKVVLKAQVHTGGRGKAGGIRVAQDAEHAAQLAAEMIGMVLRTHQAPEGVRVERLLAEEPVDIAQEYYASVVPDRSSQRSVLILSAMGGMDIEAVAEEHPEAIARAQVDPAIGLRDYQLRQLCHEAAMPLAQRADLMRTLRALYETYASSDATMVEVNPLAVTSDGRLLATDAKISIDDNALYRHPELAEWTDASEEDPIEAEAHRKGIQYVRLGGHIGVLGNGAGLVMATLDAVARAGGKPANFLDIGGGARSEVVRESLALVLSDTNVRGVLFNIYGGITRGDEVARGILEATRSMDIRVPIVVRLAGTNAAEGAALLRGTSITPALTMADAAAEIVRRTAA